MAGSAKDLVNQISAEARRQRVPFVLWRSGAKHAVYRLGGTVVLVLPRSRVKPQSRVELLKRCEPELGHRWWMPADRRPDDRADIPDGGGRGYRGPRRRVRHAVTPG